MNNSTVGGVEVTLAPGHRITRFYTLARRFPTLIGRLPNGSDIPYGPYTVGQFVTGVCLLVVGYRTMPLWGGGRGLFVNGPLLLGLTAAVVIVMRKVPWRGRGPVPVLRGMLGSYSATEGTYRGKSLPARQATAVMGGVVVADEAAMIAAQALLQQRHPIQLPATAKADARTAARTEAWTDMGAGAPASAAALTQNETSRRGAATRFTIWTSAMRRQDVKAAATEVTASSIGPSAGFSAEPSAEPSTGPLTGVQRLRQQARATTTTGATTRATAGATAGSTGRH